MNALDKVTDKLRQRFTGRKREEKTATPTNRAQLRAMGIQGEAAVIDRFDDGQVYGRRRGSFLGRGGMPAILVSHASLPGWRERFVQKIYAGRTTRMKRTAQRMRAQGTETFVSRRAS